MRGLFFVSEEERLLGVVCLKLEMTNKLLYKIYERLGEKR